MEIRLTRGKTAIVDDIDCDLASLKWYFNSRGYAGRRKENNSCLYMHRVILERKIGRRLLEAEETDHINGNGLDNRRCNLRIANRTQNNRNRRRQSNNSSGLIGVSFNQSMEKWQVHISVNGKRMFLGYYENPIDGAKVYNQAAKTYHGAFATLNPV